MSDEIQTVEVSEPVVEEKVERPSVEQAKAAGWSATEIESAKKRNMLTDGELSTEEAKDKKEAGEKVKAEAILKANEKPEEKKDVKPQVNFLDEMDRELTPEQEKVFLENFPPGTKPRAFYFRAKNERHRRQAVEARNRELEEQLKNAPKVEKKVLDEEGNEIDPDDKPLTLKQLRELQEKERVEYEKKQSEQQERSQRVTEAQTFQEEYAKSIYPDFDDTVNKAKEVMQNLESLIPEKHKQIKAVKLFRELQTAAAQADKIGVDEYNAAMIAYEIGQLHPEYGKKAEIKPDGKQPLVDPKANGGLTPEQMKRAEANTQRRASSASIPGGNGKRTVVAEEVTHEELNRMNYEDRSRFKKNHPNEYAKLIRG